MTTTTDHTALVPALLYESLPKPSPYPFDTPPSPTSTQPHRLESPNASPRQRDAPSPPVTSRHSHPRYEVKLRLPFYPGVAYQASTPGYPPRPLGAQRKAATRTPVPEQRSRHSTHRDATNPSPPETPQPPRTTSRNSLSDRTGHEIRDALIHAATPPPTVSLLHPTGEFARRVDTVARARRAEERIPKEHLPKRRITLRLWRFLPLLRLAATCHHCRRPWPCHRLRAYLTKCHGPRIDWQLHRLSSKRRRARAARRDTTTITHRLKPRRIDRREQRIQPRRA